VDKDISLSIHLHDDVDDTVATARLDFRGELFETAGRARRNPLDDPRPVIGEELAIARALSELHHQLVEAAWGKIYTADIGV
jgi:hypothetical protein